MSDRKALAKLGNVTKVFEAALVLHRLGLSKEAPGDVVKRCMDANPDVVDYVSRNPYPTPAESEPEVQK